MLDNMELNFDLDGDGINDSNVVMFDIDGDGVTDIIGVDIGGDGTIDGVLEAVDTDGDGLADSLSFNAFDDGYQDMNNQYELNYDTDGDGVNDAYAEMTDTDGDGINDTLVIDKDLDGYADIELHDVNQDGIFDRVLAIDHIDTDGDGFKETTVLSMDDDNNGIFEHSIYVTDTNGDGIEDQITHIFDHDQDGQTDEILSYMDKNLDGNFESVIHSFDSDHDGVMDTIDISQDCNGDGMADYTQHSQLIDTDGDGVFDRYIVGTDEDGDGVFDAVQVYDYNAATGELELTSVEGDFNANNSQNFGNFDPDRTDPENVAGDPGKAMTEWEFQGSTNRCAVYSQKFVIEEITGQDIDIEELADLAEENGWFSEAGGTPVVNMSKILDHFGIESETTYNNTLDDLKNALENGHKVIVSVDADEIWYGDNDTMFTPGQAPNHAVEVIGLDYSDPDHPMVILNDSGTPDGCGEMVPADIFVDAWDDGSNHMITI